VGQQLFTFAVLFAAILTFWQLNKRHELIVLRSAGLSVWQFIVPIIFAAFLIGVVKIMMINPLSVLLTSRYETLESQYLDKRPNPINISEQGLWLRQDYNQGSIILHASEIRFPEWLLKNLTVFILDGDDGFIERLDAETARLGKGQWEFEAAIVNKPKTPPQEYNQIALKTDITVAQLEKSFSSADTISFWKFPGYIKTLDDTGFNSRPLKIYFQSLLSQPLLFMSMILLAAAVSLRPPRTNGAFSLILGGVGIGFVVFFASNFLQALGASAQIPLFIAAWFPAIITFILGIGVLMTLEDG
jgi:lipopolysaccharide export system permease protein